LTGLVIVDSSAFLSLEDADERSHQRTRDAFRELVLARRRLVTTNFVFGETYTLIMSRLGRDRAVSWASSFLAGRVVELLRVTDAHEDRAWEIILDFEDKDFSYTDATTFAVAENLGIPDALSLDRHFRQVGTLNVLPGR
jgi:predicted nucleic acid-binding protein